MKISERRIKEIIAEEAQRDDILQKEAMQRQLQTIALQAAMLHDGLKENAKMSNWITKKLNSLAEDIDDVYYHFINQNTGFFEKKDS
jgi:hypothetical protein